MFVHLYSLRVAPVSQKAGTKELPRRIVNDNICWVLHQALRCIRAI